MTTNLESKLNQRRNNGGTDAVLAYIHAARNHFTFDQFRSYLTVDELAAIEARKEKEKAEIEARKQAFAEGQAAHQQELDAYWKKHPVKALTELPDLDDASELFDVLAGYHVTEVTYEFACDYWPDGEFSGYQNQSMSVQFAGDDVGVELEDIPDENDIGIADTLTEVIQELGNDYANDRRPGRLMNGVVTFDVVERKI